MKINSTLHLPAAAVILLIFQAISFKADAQDNSYLSGKWRTENVYHYLGLDIYVVDTFYFAPDGKCYESGSCDCRGKDDGSGLQFYVYYQAVADVVFDSSNWYLGLTFDPRDVTVNYDARKVSKFIETTAVKPVISYFKKSLGGEDEYTLTDVKPDSFLFYPKKKTKKPSEVEKYVRLSN